MADSKISALVSLTAPVGEDLLPIVDDPGGTPVSKKITVDDLFSRVMSAANKGGLGISGYSLTGTDSTSFIDLAGTWNTSGNPVAIKLDITDTASGASSLLTDLQVDSSSVFTVDLTGLVTPSGGVNVSGTFGGDGTWMSTNGINVEGDDKLSFGNEDVVLRRDGAADTLALRRTTNNQRFNIYGTYTDGSNYEMGYFQVNTFGLTIATDSAGTGTKRAIRLLGQGLSGSDAVSILELTQTWNTTGAPSAISMDITDTASDAASLLMDLQVDSSTQFSVSKAGEVSLSRLTATLTDLEAQLGGSGIFKVLTSGAVLGVGIDPTNESIRFGSSADVILQRDIAADTLALRRTTNPQIFNIYNTYTNVSNYERGSLKWTGGIFSIDMESAGTGTTRNFRIRKDTNEKIVVGDTVQMAANVSFEDNLLTKPVLKDYGEAINAIGSIGGGTQDIDFTAGNIVTGTVDTSATTFTFSNPPASGTAGSFTLILTNGGSQTVSWPAAVKWEGGTAPTLTTNGVDVLTFTTLDGGAIWYGFVGGLNLY